MSWTNMIGPKEQRLVYVFSPEGEPLGVEDELDDCKGWGTERCGGCGRCLLMQAAHYGCRASYSEHGE